MGKSIYSSLRSGTHLLIDKMKFYSGETSSPQSQSGGSFVTQVFDAFDVGSHTFFLGILK